MYLFLITFLALYGGMHFYTFRKLRDAFYPRPYNTWLLIFWMTIMTITPLLVRGAEQFGMEKVASVIAWPGYLWMGFLFIFTSILLFIDTLHQSGRFVMRHASYQLPPRKATVSALIIAILASLYSVFEAGHIRSEHVVITSTKITAPTSRIRIVQISDVHIGLLLGNRRLQLLLEKIKEAAPDIIISTGDLIDGKLNREDIHSGHNPRATLLASAQAPLGKFAIIGNHEVYAGLAQSIAFTRAAGFIILRNQSVQLTNGITLTGIDDRAVNPKARTDQNRESSLLKGLGKY